MRLEETLSVHRINPEPGAPYGFNLNPQETTATDVYANTEEGKALLRKFAGRGDRPTTDKHGRTFVMLLPEDLKSLLKEAEAARLSVKRSAT